MNPFMHTFTDPPMACWHNELLAANGCVYAIARFQQDWTTPYVAFSAMFRGRQHAPPIVGYDLFAHPDSWAEVGARNLAAAYRPENAPR